MNTKAKNSSSKTHAEQYAERRARGIVSQAIWTVWIATGGAALIVAGAMWVNYSHQHSYLLMHVEPLAAKLAPIMLDLLTVICGVVLALPVATSGSKWVAGLGLMVGVGGSSTLSALAPGDLVGKCVAGGMVALIAIAELVANHIHIDFAKLEAQEVNALPPQAAKPRKVQTLAEKTAALEKRRETLAAKRAAKDAAKAAAPQSPGSAPARGPVPSVRQLTRITS